MTPEQAIREMAARLIHQPNRGFEEVRELARMALSGLEAAVAQRDEYGRDQYAQGVEDTQAEVARLREALDDLPGRYFTPSTPEAVRARYAEALAALDALEAESARLREALEEIGSIVNDDKPSQRKRIEGVVRAALGGDNENARN